MLLLNIIIIMIFIRLGTSHGHTVHTTHHYYLARVINILSQLTNNGFAIIALSLETEIKDG